MPVDDEMYLFGDNNTCTEDLPKFYSKLSLIQYFSG
jgi:hypothetical protein